VIAGEDFALVNFEFAQNGLLAIWDANRYNEPNYENPRLTFGEFQIDGLKGSIRLYSNGKITIQKLGKPETEHPYEMQPINFSGDCVYTTQRHFIDCLLNGEEFETNGNEYLKSLAVQEAVYKSAETGMPVKIN